MQELTHDLMAQHTRNACSARCYMLLNLLLARKSKAGHGMLQMVTEAMQANHMNHRMDEQTLARVATTRAFYPI
jgi:hypothetical protein